MPLDDKSTRTEGPLDASFGDRVIALGLASPADVEAAMRVQQEALAAGRSPRLGEILIEHKVLSLEQVEHVLGLQGKRILICDDCLVQYNAREFAPDRQYGCPKCGVRLRPLDVLDSVIASDSVHGIAPGAERKAPDTELAPVVPALARAPKDTVEALPSPPDPYLGATVGGYVLQRLLGRGGMGRVYLGLHQVMEKLAAVKVLSNKHARDPRSVERFFLEARAAARMEHPNIVQILDANRDGEVVYLAMQFVDGRTLDRIVKQRKGLPWREAAGHVRDAAQALAYAHERKIVHRDVKPDNIMVMPDATVRLMDFGLAKDVGVVSRLTQAGQILGTPFYMSPEQCEGSEVTGQADVYSLGVSFYYAVTGKHPFTGSSTMQVVMKHLEEQADPPGKWVPDLPAPVTELIAEMMRKDPFQRPMAAEVGLRLTDLLEQIADSPAAGAGGEARGGSGKVPMPITPGSAGAAQGSPGKVPLPAVSGSAGTTRPGPGKAPVAAEPESTEPRICSFCEADNLPGARKCSVCGEPLTSGDALEVQMLDDERRCAACGQFIPRNTSRCTFCAARFCAGCGVRLTVEARFCPACGDATDLAPPAQGWWQKLVSGSPAVPNACPGCGGALLAGPRICPLCKKRNCPVCGTNNDVRAAFCAHCGRPQKSEKGTAEAETAP